MVKISIMDVLKIHNKCFDCDKRSAINFKLLHFVTYSSMALTLI